MQRQLPGVRLRLIGRPPGERTVKGVQVDCIKSEDAHCGWAWGTVYSGVEESNGIDELGYLSAEGLLEEVLSRDRGLECLGLGGALALSWYLGRDIRVRYLRDTSEIPQIEQLSLSRGPPRGGGPKPSRGSIRRWP